MSFGQYPFKSSSSTGTVTSVGLADGSTVPIYTISGSPVTSSGTLTFTLSTQTANKVFASATSGGAAQPGFRALVAGDLPTGNLTDAGTDGITVTSGTNAVIGSGTSIAQHVADSTHNGYLSSADWVTFNAKQAALTIGNFTDAGTDGIVVTGGSSCVIGSGTSIAQHVADASHNGYLSSTDWSTFNSKQSALTFAQSITNTAGTVALTNDTASPGNSKFYGTDSGGTRGWQTSLSGTVTSVAMTVPTFLSVSGSPVTSSGTLAVTLSGTALPIANGGTAVTSVTTSPTASSFAGWDANKNLSANNFLAGYATTATAGTTTTLVVGDAEQQYFTGSTTQTVKLPVTSTLVLGQSFTIVNLSSGAVTVQSSGANTIQAMGANTELVVTCILTSGTGTASWSALYASTSPATVTSVALSVPSSSLFGVTGSPVTTSGTLGLTTTGTSGGIPYFSSTSALSSSGALTVSQLVLGGGAGASPTSLAAGSQYQVLRMGATTPAYGSINLDQAAAITGTLPVGNGGTGVASVTTSPTASSFAGWDANKNLSANNHIQGYRTTATAAGTTTLVIGDAYQQFFTGSTTQTVLLPVTSTLVLGFSYLIENLSSGVVTVQSSGANTLQAMAANTRLIATCILTSGTGTASWDWQYAALGTIPIALGGTGQTTKAAAFDALSPMTTGGDIIYGGASGTGTRLANGNSGQFLKSNGTTTAPSWGSFTAGSVQTFTSGSGTYTPTTGALWNIVYVVAGGGSGGGCPTGVTGSCGGGGGGGGFVMKLNASAASASYGVGAGGTQAGTGAGGNTGSNSTFASITASGGVGGGAGSATAGPVFVAAGGAGGAATGGDLNVPGGAGGVGTTLTATSVLSGPGGICPWGMGAAGRVNSTGAGTTGQNYGSGGSGGAQISNGAAQSGGAGSPGIIIVYEFYA